MGRSRRLHMQLARDEAMRVNQASIRRDRLCYVIVADRRLKYTSGRSAIAYIGTTKRGLGRVAGSAAQRAPEVFKLRAVRSFTVRIVSCQGRPNVRTWAKLERAMLLIFKDLYGEIPHCNSHGKGMRERDEFDYFQERRLRRLVEELG